MMMDDSKKMSHEDCADESLEGGELTNIVKQVSDNLSMMQTKLAEEGVPSELTDRLGKLNDDYQALLREIQSAMDKGEASEDKEAAPGGMVDANAGRGGRPLLP
jgi:hypothetical protein